ARAARLALRRRTGPARLAETPGKRRARADARTRIGPKHRAHARRTARSPASVSAGQRRAGAKPAGETATRAPGACRQQLARALRCGRHGRRLERSRGDDTAHAQAPAWPRPTHYRVLSVEARWSARA